MDPYSRCSLCGVPSRMLQLFKRRNIPVPSTRSNRWRLEVDRISPGGPYTLGNCRLLCAGCNAERGDAKKTDGQVALTMRKRWEWALSPRFLWWLNTFPGGGGRPFRGIKHEKGDEDEVPIRD